jgi:hypothetical protein
MVHRSMGGTCTSCKAYGTAGWLSFNDFENVLFHPLSYIERGQHPIALREMFPPPNLKFGGKQKGRY